MRSKKLKGDTHFTSPISLLTSYFLLLTSIIGCLSLDYTPFNQQPFYGRTRAEIARFHPDPPASGPLLAGAAKVSITPPVGLPLAAYGARLSVGIHDPVFARALVLSNGRFTVAVVAVDLLAIPDDLSRAVAKRLEKKMPLSSDHLMIAATHTHSGPGALGRRFWESLAAGPFNAGFFEITAERIAKAVVEAYQDRRPSQLAVVKFDAGDMIQNRMIPQGPTDPHVQVLVVQALDQSRTAYLVNFSAHPTVLRSKNRLVSGDFPGFLSQTLEQQQGVIALYTSGAVADQRARPPQVKGVFERARRMGEELARRVRESSSSGSFGEEVSLASVRFSVSLPPPQPKVTSTRRLPAWIGRLIFDNETDLQVMRINQLLLIGVPADLGVEIGLAWKEAARIRGMEALIVGFSNDYVGYVMPAKYYEAPAYEAFMSFNGPYMADYLDRIVMTLLNSLTEPAAIPP